jgi:hypothetical protein
LELVDINLYNVSWYAETWLREVYKRCWSFTKAVFTGQGIGDLKDQYMQRIRDTLNDTWLIKLVSSGSLGRALDYYTEMIAYHLWTTSPKNPIVSTTVIFDFTMEEDDSVSFHVLLKRFKDGPHNDYREPVTISAAIPKKIQALKNVLKDLSTESNWEKRISDYIQNNIKITQIRNPLDNYYYTSLAITGPYEQTDPNPKEILRTTYETIGYALNDQELLGGCEYEWIIHDFTLSKIPGFRTTTVSLSNNQLIVCGDPFKDTILVSLTQQSITASLQIDRRVLYDSDIIIKRIIDLVEIDTERTEFTNKKENNYWLAILQKGKPLGLSYLSLSCKNNLRDFFPFPGMFYIAPKDEPLAIVFHVGFWESIERVQKHLQRHAIVPIEIKEVYNVREIHGLLK